MILLFLVILKCFTYIFQKKPRQPGDRWMIRGPLEYVPPVEVDVATKRKAIPLDENEGIYVRHVKSGKVSAFRVGKSSFSLGSTF